MDSVLENWSAMTTGTSAAPVAAAEEPFMVGTTDRRVPSYLAAAVVGSVITLVALRMAGFRFSFGATIGGGQGG